MFIRLPVSFAFALMLSVLLPAVGQAQNVLVPLDSPPPSDQSSQSQPAAPMPLARDPAPVARASRAAAVPSVAPQLPHAGIAHPWGEEPAVPGMTPEQMAQGRRTFEAMAAYNPQAARYNPFAQYDALKLAQKIQKDISKRVRDACGLDFFNVQVSVDMLKERVLVDNLNKYGVPSFVGAMRSVCSDSKLRDAIRNGVGSFSITHRRGQKEPMVEGSALTGTFSYDFTNPDGPSPEALNTAMRAGMSKITSGTATLIRSFDSMNQDEMERQITSGLLP